MFRASFIMRYSQTYTLKDARFLRKRREQLEKKEKINTVKLIVGFD